MEFLTMDEAKSKFGTKGRTNAGLTLGIIGTALAAFAGNNGGCGCGNGGGILGNLFGGNNNCCAMQAAENAKTLAMAQGQQADNLLATIRKSKEHIHAQLKAKEDKYGKYLDIFTDVHGNINLELLANAVKAEMKEKSADGFVVNILNKPVRFGEDDVNQLVEIFKTFKQNN
jgi:hypothetical protein